MRVVQKDLDTVSSYVVIVTRYSMYATTLWYCDYHLYPRSYHIQ